MSAGLAPVFSPFARNVAVGAFRLSTTGNAISAAHLSHVRSWMDGHRQLRADTAPVSRTSGPVEVVSVSPVSRIRTGRRTRQCGEGRY